MSAHRGDSRVAIVTGGAGVLGRAIARTLADQGSDIVLLDLDREMLKRAVAGLQEQTSQLVVGWEADISDEATVTSALGRLEDEYGRLDQLINNAAINPPGGLKDLSTAAWDRAMAVNLRGPMLMARAAMPLWAAESAGRIVNIASRTWLSGGPPAYTTTKAGLVGLTRSLALELAPLGVTVNAVAPSMVLTDFTRDRHPNDYDAFIAHHTRMSPLRRIATPEDVANAVGFLASPGAGFITGEVLHVCGGSQLAAAP